MKYRAFSYPYILWVIIFIIVPMGLVIFFSFTDINGNFTFKNIIEVSNYSGIFLNSIGMGLLATAICLIIGYPIAYILSKLDSKNQNLAIMLIMLPMWINFLLRTYAWMTLLENNGLINKFIAMFGIQPVQMINTSGAIVLGMVYNFLPFMILPIYTVITKLDENIIEAAKDLGANRFNVFLRIILPLSIPGIISGFTMVFVPAVSTFVISKMLGGGANLLIGDLIDMQFLGSSYNPNLGSAMSLVLMLLILICMGIMNQFNDSYAEERMII